ncbi:MAG TPA: geranylgeranylglyceryl/heptaprenylglyceryl phosphate synthase [Acidobacteriota bacterium]|nr:geranylgeranylglyceryl/heptaprenylglyceryl phosphate synthase [Acidobacteriota bacterium]
MSGPIYRQLLRARTNGPGFLWLIDPDKIDPQNSDPRWQEAHNYGVTAILVGTSQKCETPFDRHVARIRHHAKLPLILFPGSATQISAYVDAVLFLMLLSGRNPDYLVGEQVKGTPAVRDYGIEPIPTGYLLIDTGSETSVVRESRTAPLPENDSDAICHHALCAQYMGQSFVYLEAGSGAGRPVAPHVIEAVKRGIDIPLIVGGGMRTPESCADAAAAGADFVVVGTALENNRSPDLLREMTEAVQYAGSRVGI